MQIKAQQQYSKTGWLALAAILLFCFSVASVSLAKELNTSNYTQALTLSAEQSVLDLSLDDPESNDLHINHQLSIDSVVSTMLVSNTEHRLTPALTNYDKQARAPPAS
ncbi:hypothetical protein QX776_03750 [Alteromonadaceae bacterium BrNp21-10]|nr:hypothetical protein [Alteromonadaceae bacterium BrNp21-10]